MPRSNHYTGVADYSDASSVQPVQAAVLLVNLGTPTAPTAKALRRYLGEFLADSRVIDYPRWLWWLILHGVILRVRPKRSAHAYAKIWTDQGSPLRFGSEALAAGLQAELDRQQPGKLRVALAMRYGEPSVAHAIDRLQREGVRRLLVLPLYPQYSATSSGSVIDAVADTLKTLRWPPELRIITLPRRRPAWRWPSRCRLARGRGERPHPTGPTNGYPRLPLSRRCRARRQRGNSS